jgi:hypothetical protein
LFDGTETRNIIPFASNAVNDKKYGIHRGRITLSLDELKQMFEGSIEATLASCWRLFAGQTVEVSINSRKTSTIIILCQNLMIVGGFGESPYLRNRLREALDDDDILVTEMKEPGSVFFYLTYHQLINTTEIKQLRKILTDVAVPPLRS